jgi:predicted dinucleotide-binding enzyme
VVKTFNNIYARHLMEKGHPAKRFRLHCAAVAGGDAKAKVVVMRLVEELGFDRVHAGGLDDSWPHLPGTPV